ncbi:MAG: DMT family transporter [Alphaproteobacteria bacterium]|nr:DMT family transporter [Alphaproteobacteria bacterium]
MPPIVILAALIAVIVWGASPVATKLAVNDLSPLSVSVLRTVIGGLCALPLALLMRIPLPATGSQRGTLFLSGFCGFIAFPLLFSIGVEKTSANHASMILASLPLFTGAIAHLWDRKTPVMVWWAGCAVALVGEAFLIGGRGATDQIATTEGDLLVLAGNTFAALGYVAGARLQREGYAATGTTFWGAAVAALALLPIALFISGDIVAAKASWLAWGGVLYLALGVTIFGYVLWYFALGKGGIARMGLFQFFQPVSGVILAALLLGETIGWSFLGASGVIMLGVWFAVRAK